MLRPNSGPHTCSEGAATCPPHDLYIQVYTGSVYGIGEDNPQLPEELTDMQRNRSLLVMFERTSYFQVPWGRFDPAGVWRGGCSPTPPTTNL